MDCFYNNLISNDSYICGFKSDYSCIMCNKCCGFLKLLEQKNLLEAFYKNPSSIDILYRDLISAEIYWLYQDWKKRT